MNWAKLTGFLAQLIGYPTIFALIVQAIVLKIRGLPDASMHWQWATVPVCVALVLFFLTFILPKNKK